MTRWATLIPSPMMLSWPFRSFTRRTGPRLTPSRTASAPALSRIAIAANSASSGSPMKVTAAPSPVSRMIRSRGGTCSSDFVSSRLNSCLRLSCSDTGFFEYSTISRKSTLQTSVRPELSIRRILFHAHPRFRPGVRRNEEYARILAFIPRGGGHHTPGHTKFHLARLQIRDQHGEAALELLGSVARLYARENSARAIAELERQLQ